MHLGPMGDLTECDSPLHEPSLQTRTRLDAGRGDRLRHLDLFSLCWNCQTLSRNDQHLVAQSWRGRRLSHPSKHVHWVFLELIGPAVPAGNNLGRLALFCGLSWLYLMVVVLVRMVTCWRHAACPSPA